MITEHEVRAGGVQLRYAEAGSNGTPLLLLHGLNWDHTVWRDVMTRMAVTRRVIALDLPGHGASDAPSGPYTPAWLAGGVRAFMDALDIPRAILVGNSLGGLVAATLAAADPDRVAAAALVAPALPNDDPPADKRSALTYLVGGVPFAGLLLAERFFGRDPAVVIADRLANNLVDPTRVSDAVRDGILVDAARRGRSGELLRAGVKTTRKLVWALTAKRESTWSMLRSIRVPTVFVWGDKDATVPITIADRALREVGGAHLLTLDDCGHTPQIEHPDAFSRVLDSFIRATEAVSA